MLYYIPSDAAVVKPAALNFDSFFFGTELIGSVPYLFMGLIIISLSSRCDNSQSITAYLDDR